jgi:hypothetical protein
MRCTITSRNQVDPETGLQPSVAALAFTHGTMPVGNGAARGG